MTFEVLVNSGKRLIFDGGMGTMLQKNGLMPGESPSLFCLRCPEILQHIHEAYVQSGADVITTNTFGGTRYKLEPEIGVIEFNQKMAEVARRASVVSGRKVWVAGDIGPTGKLLRPLGDSSFAELIEAFQEQVQGLLAGGVDLFIVETQFDIAEARAAVVAIRRECDLPVVVSMTYENGKTLTGSSVAVCTATLINMGVTMVGMNCSAGPVEMKQAVAELLNESSIPVLVQPNAGLPELQGDQTIFPLEADKFADLTAEFARVGVQAVGGCCGTTPDHIAMLRRQVDALEPVSPRIPFAGVALTSRSELVRIGESFPLCIIGERINPTGKKQLTASLQSGEFILALRYAAEQIAAGAPVLDVNVGAPMVDERKLLPDLLTQLLSACSVPLAIDSSNTDAVIDSLDIYPASPLVNSISGEEGRMERLGPLCRDFGAPFILLPLQGKNLPVTAKERIVIIESLLRQMEDLRIPRSLAVVDILALSVSSQIEAGKECLEFIRYCRNILKLPTVCGLSNVSFGLPARDLLNSTFLGLAVGAGMNGCIANPSNPRLAEAMDAIRVLSGHDDGAEHFVASYAQWKHGETVSVAGRQRETSVNTVEGAVIAGRKDLIPDLIRKELDKGADPFALVGDRLIPAITEVGALYEKKEYFLPQLIRSAEAMQAGFAILRPLLEQDSRQQERPTIILATVEGDIHDIGKNIVGLMLGNHGFEVVDLGKDVPAEVIVEAAEKHNAPLIGLSALMTTTMVRMQDTIDLLAKKKMSQKVMIGGAVVTGAFARSIGAHYSKDAVGAVRLARELLDSCEKVKFE